MHGPAGAVALELGEVESLGHHSLPGEGRVAVEQERQDVEGPVAGKLVLLGAHDALEDGIDRLEMGRIRCDVDLGLVAVEAPVGAARAQVVLHVAGALNGLLAVVALELSEDLGVGLARDVGQHVEATTMRHADGHFDDVVARC